jgi:hypothetical protein
MKCRYFTSYYWAWPRINTIFCMIGLFIWCTQSNRWRSCVQYWNGRIPRGSHWSFMWVQFYAKWILHHICNLFSSRCWSNIGPYIPNDWQLWSASRHTRFLRPASILREREDPHRRPDRVRVLERLLPLERGEVSESVAHWARGAGSVRSGHSSTH